jgi:hypothetical protein
MQGDLNLQQHCCGNLKPQISLKFPCRAALVQGKDLTLRKCTTSETSKGSECILYSVFSSYVNTSDVCGCA